MYFSLISTLLLLATSSFVSAVYQPSAQTLAVNDIHVLQYALILEDLEYTFYNTFQNRFTAQDFISANIGLTAADYSYFNLIRNHELAHVLFLNSTVPSPTTSCTYNFPVNSVADYIGLAQVFENVGVSAYDGAINNINNPDYAQAAATIATIEARHASYLNRITGNIPFPLAFDLARNSSTVANIVFGGGYANCQFAEGFTLPELYIVYPVQNASDASQPTPQSLLNNDVTVLQYALFLEHLEANFYAYVLANFNSSQFANNQTYNYINLIAQHEATHVSALSSVISGFGFTPLPACSYNFAAAINGNISNAINIAVALEGTGVGAYDGAVNAINDPTLQQVAATIATVEARHASYLNYVAQNAQGPVQGAGGAFDIALTFNATYGIVIGTNLINSCPTFPSPYSVLIVKPYTNATFNSDTTGTTGGTTSGTTSGSTTSASTTGTVTPTPSPTPIPGTTGTPAGTTSGTTGTPAGTTGTPAGTTSTTGTPSGTTTGATTARATTGSATAASSTTARTSGASIASASLVVALFVAVAAF